MFKQVNSRVSFPKMEKEILSFWNDRQIFAQSLKSREKGPLFAFYEGPPTANGSPGIHHVLARVFKDVILRYRTMKGYYVPRKGGWDTHGLPVELEVEKELGFSGKQEIESYGIAPFNAKCKDSVFRYVKEWEDLTERIAFWVDMKDAYVTFYNSYVESGWWIVKQLWDKGLVFLGYKVTPHCPRCGTSLSSHEVALGYKDDTDDPSVYVKFELYGEPPVGVDGSKDVRAFFLVWTTTPWTLPGNVALAVHPDEEYVLVELASPEGERGIAERLILAKDLLGAAVKGEYTTVATLRGRDLVGTRYVPLFTFVPIDVPAHRVVAGDFVSMEDGTGIVHIAPGYGEIDLEVGRAENLPVVQTVDLRGQMTDLPASFSGLFVKDADPLIIEDLAQRGLMYRSERIVHTYPFCWRCDTPLLYYAKTSWYIRTTALKERLLANNEKINWYPEHIKRGRFGDWLENNVDWAISRERYWGTPLPIWRCADCGELECMGSVKELEERSGRSDLAASLDLHRPYVDEVTFACGKCGGTMYRVSEVMDCWFDSGAMPVSQWHYPFDNKETFQRMFPADYICEAVDQTRGWFYSLHALSTLLFDEQAYKNVICLGHILDAKGEKMSKSKGNVVSPWEVIDLHGADATRWYLFTATPPGNPRRFSLDLVGEAVRKFLLTFWNTYSFFVIYANIDKFDPKAVGQNLQLAELDRWILSELHQLIQDADASLDGYEPTAAGRAIETFVDNLSNWYVRRSRRRFWKSESDAEKLAAYATLYECLVTVAKLLAPFTPFIADELYRNLVGSVDAAAPESVHLAGFPAANPALIDQQLMSDVQLVMKMVSFGRAARSKANLKVRQPLAKMVVKPRSDRERESLRRLAAQIMDELNIKELVVVEDESELVDYTVRPKLNVLGPKYGREVGRLSAALSKMDPRQVALAAKQGKAVFAEGFELFPDELLVDTVQKAGYAVAEEAGYVAGVTTQLTPDLVEEGLAREVVHRLQTMRRSADFDISDQIDTYYQGDPEVEQVIAKYASYVKQETLSRALLTQLPPPDAYVEEHIVDGRRILLGVKR
ncbi:MAG: isoleucine--tRNA ligase [Chloroflexi bacterium]|nr:isoleucine--tRNA ligase [Chloroflexota bacterium]